MTDTPPPLDLTTCEAEPIHIPGRVQPHGVLLVLAEPGLTVTQVSANAFELLGATPAELIGRPIVPHVSEASQVLLGEMMARPDPRPWAPVNLTVGGRPFEAVAHRHAGRLILELEPATSAASMDPDRLVRFTLLSLRNGLHLQGFCGEVAREVRALTGYDRVMVYRFDPEWNGEVVAEEKRDDLEPFLGLHYPASDIPAQARRLYHLNWVRHIPTITYTSAPLVPELNPTTGGPLDLSHAVLRSVSPIHVEYLQNMGVAGTLTISLLKDGRLWGLVACHHYSPLQLPYRVRAACESLAVLVSLQLSAKLDAEDMWRRVEAQARLARLVAALDAAVPLTALADDLVGLTGSTGAALVLGERTTLLGRVPAEAAVRRLAEWLKDGGHDEFVTNALPAAYPEASAEVASGLLAVRIGGGSYLMWFRQEVVGTVSWAGNPRDKRTVIGPNGPRLSPRGSFALWSEEQRGKSDRWTECDRDASRSFREVVRVQWSAGLVAEAQRRDDFLAAVAHELRNPLAPIRNAVNLIRMAPSKSDVTTRAADMIDRQAGNLNRLVEDLLDASRAGRGKLRVERVRADFGELVRVAVEDRRAEVEKAGLTLALRLPAVPVFVLVDPLRLTQVVGNLLGNATKFSDGGDAVTVSVTAEGPMAELAVADTGIGIAPENLPKVFEAFAQVDGAVDRSRDGLGLGLALVRAIAEMHDGNARAESAGLGLGSSLRVRIPLAPAE